MNFKKETLDLSNKNLTEFPPEIFDQSKLRKLSLRNNQIKAIPQEIADLVHLETLDLSNNKITRLYAKIFKLPKLKILILDNNQISSLPRQIADLKNLKILSFSGNKLKEIPEELSTLPVLEELNISGNQLTSFPRQLLKVSSLKTLWLSKNRFIDFPAKEIMTNLTHLKRLYCFGQDIDRQVENLHCTYQELIGIKGNSWQYLKTNVQSAPLVDALGYNPSTPETVKPVRKSSKNKIFISYSHADTKWLTMVKTHLKSLAREGKSFDLWEDTRIEAGNEWKVEIEKALAEAPIAILIISADFIASDFIMDNELPPLLQNAKEKGTKILSLIVRPCRFIQNKELSVFQSVNDPGSEILSKCPEHLQESILVRLAADVASHIS